MAHRVRRFAKVNGKIKIPTTEERLQPQVAKD